MILKTDPDFKNLIPPLAPEEFQQLKDNILSAGLCREAILVWKRFIVDGHNRYAICMDHNIPFEVSKLNFASKQDALIWIVENQLGRRNLTDAARIELACRKVEMLQQTGKVTGRIRTAIAEISGLGEQVVHRYMKIIGKAEPELIEQVRRGEVKIGTAYGQLQVATKTINLDTLFQLTDGEDPNFCARIVISRPLIIFKL